MLGFDAVGRLALGQVPGATATATVYEDSWHQPFSTDIVRRLRPMHTGAQQFAAFVGFAPFGEQWTPNRFWAFPLSQPVIPRKPTLTGLPPSSQQFAAFVQFAPFNENIKVNEWFVPFSEPVRFRPRLITALHWFGRGIEFPLTGAVHSMHITLLGVSTISGAPTSNYKQLLATDNKNRLIYAAEISPWTLSQ